MGKIAVEALVKAPLETVWQCWTTPDDITKWNAASDDWHTVRASVDLKEGGIFTSRMEAKDGSMGFDFEGTYTQIIPHELIEADIGGRQLRVEFIAEGDGVRVREIFDAEDEHSEDMQRQGWQAILDNFTKYADAKL